MTDLMTQGERSQATLISPTNTAEQFGKVYYLQTDQSTKVEITIRELMGTEGWHTGVAIDGSWSMRALYGRGLKKNVTLTPAVIDSYKAKGWIQEVRKDGKRFEAWQKSAHVDAIKNGHMSYTENEVESLIHDCTKYLLDELESGEGVDLIYWACGRNGQEVEKIGLVDEDSLSTIKVDGPKKFGEGTYLAPAMQEFLKAKDKKQILVFVTDGRLDDLDEVINLTKQIAQEIDSESRPMTKCVLIGVGESVDRNQLETLDDLETGYDVDIWDQKIASEMRDLGEIIAELIDENKIIAPTASVLDNQGNILHRFFDGLPCRCAFELPAGSDHFVLAIDEFRVHQNLNL